ncbi:MAG: hypothetical protein ACYDAY_09705 [Candidatus Dormibacteria bacterium]
MSASFAPPASLKKGPVTSSTVHRSVHGGGLYGRVNTWLALAITRNVGTMTCAYLFAALAIISLPAAIASHDPIIIVAWIAQTFLQLVLLPIIIVGQNVQQAQSDVRAQTDHEIVVHLAEINARQLEILERLNKLEAGTA